MDLTCIFCHSKLIVKSENNPSMMGYFCSNHNDHEKEGKSHWAWANFNSDNKIKVYAINIRIDQYQLCSTPDQNSTRLLVGSQEFKKTILCIPEIDFFLRIKNEEDFMIKVKSLLLFM